MTDLKEVKQILNTHKNIIDLNFNKEVIIDKLTIIDSDFDLINIRIKELTLYTTSNTNFSELNELLKGIKFDYLKLYIYKYQFHNMNFLRVKIDEIFLVDVRITKNIANFLHRNDFSLTKLHFIECIDIELINSTFINLNEISFLTNMYSSYDVIPFLTGLSKIKKLQISISNIENMNLIKILDFILKSNIIEFKLGLNVEIDNNILINFLASLNKKTNLTKLYIFAKYNLDLKTLFKKINKSNLEVFYINDESLIYHLTELATKKNNNLKEISLNVLNKQYITFNKNNFYILERLTSKNCNVKKIDFLVEESDMTNIYNILKKTKVKEITIFLKSITKNSVRNFIKFFKLNLNKITLDDYYYFEYPKKRKYIDNLLDFKNFSEDELYIYLAEKVN